MQHRVPSVIVALVALVVAVGPVSARAQQPVTAQPGPVVVDVRTTIDVLAFSYDGTFALLRERRDSTTSVSARFLVVDATGITETLPLTERVRTAGMRDNVSVATCNATYKRLDALADQLPGITVVGLCSHPDRPLVKALQQPRAVVTAAVAALHQRLGFFGQTYIEPQRRFAIVVGLDFNAFPKIVATPLRDNER
ncbi:MAG TPA: hypothetical protein VGF99_21955 [Myxococcota bacterium]